MKRILIIITVVLFINTISILNFSPMLAQTGAQRDFNKLKQEQNQTLEDLSSKQVEIILGNNSVPSWLMGELGPVRGKPKRAAVETLRQLAPAFRITDDDEFEAKSEMV